MPLVLKQQIKSAASATYEIIDIEKRLADLRAARQRARVYRPGKS